MNDAPIRSDSLGRQMVDITRHEPRAIPSPHANSHIGAGGGVQPLPKDLVPSLDSAEKARGARYLAEDRKGFTAEMDEIRRRHPEFHDAEVARAALDQRERRERDASEPQRELVHSMTQMSSYQFNRLKERAAAGLPLIGGEK